MASPKQRIHIEDRDELPSDGRPLRTKYFNETANHLKTAEPKASRFRHRYSRTPTRPSIVGFAAVLESGCGPSRSPANQRDFRRLYYRQVLSASIIGKSPGFAP